MNDNDIVKALVTCIAGNCTEFGCPLFDENDTADCTVCMTKLIEHALDLINRRNAEIDRLKKGWRADVVETANAKAEVIKEFAEKVENELAPTMTALFVIGEILVDVSKSHLSSEEAVKRIRNKLKVNNAIGSLGGLNKLLDKLAKELTEAIP